MKCSECKHFVRNEFYSPIAGQFHYCEYWGDEIRNQEFDLDGIEEECEGATEDY